MTAGAAPTVALLLSDQVDQVHGARLDALAAAKGVALRRLPLASAAKHLDRINIAFFSRELYEGSSLRKPGALSDKFFRVADAAPHLRWLHVCSSGTDLPQYQPLLQRGVRITSSVGVTAVPIAQSAVAAILAQSRGFDHWLAAQGRREWAPLAAEQRPKELHDLRVLVVGAGAIGSEIGRLLRALGLQVTAVRRTSKPGSTPAEPGTSPHFDRTIDVSRLDAELPTCDWLVLALPLTDDTRGFVDARRLALLPPHARIVNVARGEIVDEQALCDALAAGRLRGAYLDTFVDEPLQQASPLWSLPRVWITPHNCAASQGHEERVVESFVEQFKGWMQDWVEHGTPRGEEPWGRHSG